MKETELWPPVEKLLIGSGMEIFKEVPVGWIRPDIVCRRHNIITVLEMKTSLSLQLLEQVHNWYCKAHYVYAVVPENLHTRTQNNYARSLLRKDRAGLIIVPISRDYFTHDEILQDARIEFPAKLHRKIDTDWNKYLLDIYKGANVIPGTNREYMTPYKDMILQVERFVKRQDKPVSLNQILKHIEAVNKHYANPKSGLYNALTRFERDRFKAELIGGKLYFTVMPKRTPVIGGNE
jgi:hypothetical protein